MLINKNERSYLLVLNKWYKVKWRYYRTKAEKALRHHDYVTWDLYRTKALYYLHLRLDITKKLLEVAR